MGFILKSVELKNIRTHEYFLFEPSLDGITAISGETGAGKSTIVDSVAWALYGTKPNSLKNKNLIRDKVDPKEKPVSAKVTAIIGGLEYVIERKIITKTGTTECNVWAKSPETGEFKQVAGPAVTHVEKFLKTEIGMNEKGFLTSVMIQQKQVDQIVSASPRERGMVIEELTGISIISNSIQKANEETRAFEKAASIFQIGNLEEVESKVKAQKEVVEKEKTREKEAIDTFKETKEKYQKMQEIFSIEEVKFKEKNELSAEEESIKKQVEFLREQAEKDMEYIAEFKKKNGSTLAITPKEVKGKLEQKRSELYLEKNKMESINKEIIQLEKDLSSCVILKKHFSNIEEAESYLENIQKDLDKKKKQYDELKEKISMYTSEIKHSKNSKSHISGEHKNCPVCKSPIEDPEELKSQIEKEIEDLQKKKKESESTVKSLSSQAEPIQEEIKETKIAIEAIKQENIINSKLEELRDSLGVVKPKIEILKSDFESLELEHEKSIKVESEKRALENAKKRSLTVYDTISELEEKIKKIKEKKESLDAPTEKKFNSMRTKIESTKDKLAKMSVAGQEIMGRRKLAQERLSDYEKDLQKVKEAMDKYNELAKEIEVKSHASLDLSHFKEDRIKESIPKLEFYASDFLTKFTGGEFLKLSLDKKFNTFVTTSKGAVRSVSQLSGGELSSAAIALRLGISMLLSSSEKNVLILDEVLVSMDEERARLIMETISSMTNSQIIFIAHSAEINTIADKTIIIESTKTKGE